MCLQVPAPQHADQRDVLQQDAVGRDRRHAAAGEADDREPALGRDAPGGLIEHIAADRIVNHVGASPAGRCQDGVHPADVGVVEHGIGALCERERPLRLAARGREHARAERLADLDCRHPDAAGAGVHQQRLAGAQPGAVVQREVRGVIRDRHRRRLGEGHLRGQREHVRGLDDGVFREATAARDRHHPIAGLAAAHAVADRIDRAGDFGAGDERKGRLDLVLALHLQDVEEIERGRVVANPHLAGPGCRRVDLVQHHRLGLAPRMHLPRLHFKSPPATRTWLSDRHRSLPDRLPIHSRNP